MIQGEKMRRKCKSVLGFIIEASTSSFNYKRKKTGVKSCFEMDTKREKK